MNYHEVIFPEFFQASLGVIPVLLLASFLNEKFTKHAKTAKRGRKFHSLSVNISITAIFFSLINLLPVAGLQEFTAFKIASIFLNLVAVFICACSVGALGLLQLVEDPEQNEDNNKHLSDSANRSVSSSEDSQQQAIDTAPQAKPRSVSPKEDARIPQKEPNSEEGTEDSDKKE